MKIAIHQPQFIPWVPYFEKIESCDLFVFLDNVDFQKNGLQNRNQIKSSQGKHWLTVPVKQGLNQKIKNVFIDNNSNWKNKHFRTLENYYRRSPFFCDYQKEIKDFYEIEWSSLCEINLYITKLMMKWLDIKTKTIKGSDLGIEGKNSDLILNICKELNCSSYISGNGGKNYLDQDKFEDNGIKIDFFETKLPKFYKQLYPSVGFINDLSALDILFNCGIKWKDYIRNF